MASLKDTRELTQSLEDLVGRLQSELSDGDVDFEKLVAISDELSEHADGLAETFSSINDTLMQRLDQAKSGRSGATRRSESKSAATKAAAGEG